MRIERRNASEDVRPRPDASAGTARREADARYRRAQQTTVELTATVLGDPSVLPKTVVEFQGISQRLSGKYGVKEATRRIDGSGYTFELRCLCDGTSELGGVPSGGRPNRENAADADPDALRPVEVVDPETGATRVEHRGGGRGGWRRPTRATSATRASTSARSWTTPTPRASGGLRVRIPGLVEPASAWAFPLGTVGGGSDRRGFFVVPEKGAEVGVLFHQGGVDHPHYLCGPWGKPDGQAEVPEPARGVPKDQVPQVRAFETPRFLLVFDDPARLRRSFGLGEDRTAGQVDRRRGGPAAARVNDSISVSLAFAAWIAAVTAVCNGIAPGSVTPPTGPIGQVAAGSAKVTMG